MDLELPSKANMNLHLCWLRILLQEGKKKRALCNEDVSISTWYSGRNRPEIVSLDYFEAWSWQKTCFQWYWSDCLTVYCLINATEHPPKERLIWDPNSPLWCTLYSLTSLGGSRISWQWSLENRLWCRFFETGGYFENIQLIPAMCFRV